jgi:transposase
MKNERKVTQVGCDCHRRFTMAVSMDEEGRVVRRERLKHRDRGVLRESLRAWPAGTPVVLEATFGWGWFADELQACGLEPRLADSRKVAGWRKAQGLAKSDRTDAELLASLWNEKRRWWEVWLAPPEVREQREQLRYRMSLVKMQTQLKNKVHAILHCHGVYHEFTDLFGVAGRRFLNLLVVPENSSLPESGRTILRGYLQLLDHFRRQIAQVTRRFHRGTRTLPEMKRLMKLPGVSWILSYTIVAEVGRIDRFRNGKHLASYSLVAPRAHDTGDRDDEKEASGESPKGRHVGFAGRRTLKWAWIQAAHGAVRKESRFREIFDRRTNGGKRDRNRGYIAVGHALCLQAHVLWSKHIDYNDTPPPRPGSIANGVGEGGRRRHKRRTSRPGTGQPDPTLVAAVH